MKKQHVGDLHVDGRITMRFIS